MFEMKLFIVVILLASMLSISKSRGECRRSHRADYKQSILPPYSTREQGCQCNWDDKSSEACVQLSGYAGSTDLHNYTLTIPNRQCLQFTEGTMNFIAPGRFRLCHEGKCYRPDEKGICEDEALNPMRQLASWTKHVSIPELDGFESD